MKRIRILLRILEPFIHSGAAVYAAAACFYVFLSALPTAILVLNLISNFPWVVSYLQDMIRYVIPEDLHVGVSHLLKQSADEPSAVVISVSGLISLWSASKGILALTDGLNAVWKTKPYSYLKRRLYGMVYFLLMMFWLILVGFVRILFFLFFPNGKMHVISVVLLWLFVSIMYSIPFATKLSFRFCMLGGFFCMSGWILSSFVFSVYLRIFSRKAFAYGVIGFLTATGVWANVVFILFLYGGLLAKMRADGSYHPLQIIRQVLRNIHE